MQPTLQEMDREGLCKLWNEQMPQDFPRGEIKPLPLLLSLYDRGKTRVFALTEQERLLAYAILEIPDEGDVWLLDYLAVTRENRGTGLGSRMLSLLPERLPGARAVLAEIERIDRAPDGDAWAVRTRRKHFYLSNGLTETGVYTRADGGIDYEILCLSCRAGVTGADAARAMERIYATFFSPDEYAVYDGTRAGV